MIIIKTLALFSSVVIIGIFFIIIPFYLVPYSNWKERIISGVLFDLFLAGLCCVAYLTNL